MMDLPDLRAFLAVARAGTLAAASDAVHLTPSALSKALRRLESSLGAPLFDRDGLRLRLNAAGERLVPRARALIDAATAIRADFDPRGQAVSATAAGPAILQWAVAPALVDAFRRAAPDGRLAFRSAYEDTAIAMLRAGDADLAIVTREAVPADPAVDSVVLGRFAIGLVQRRGDQAAPLACTPASPICGRPRSLQSVARPDATAMEHPRIQVDDMLVLLRLVQTGRVSALAPDFLGEAHDLRATEAERTDEEELVLAWRNPPTPWIETIAEELSLPEFT